MTGMGSRLQVNNPTMIAAFRAALAHQGILIAALCALLVVAWISARDWLPAAGAAGSPGRTPGPGGSAAGPVPAAGPPGRTAEPAGRRLLRIGFGVLWVLDGLLQIQPAMPLGLPSQVVQPASATSPAWVQHLTGWAAHVWTYHPVTAAASAVWIQTGIGCWLLAAARGGLSRLGGLVSVGWGLVVWVFGEAFGGVFGHGLSWLFGAPGPVVFYCAAGALISLPLRAWSSPRLGRLVLAVLGLFFAGMAVLQAWPGRGFWQGTERGVPGTLTGMVKQMSQTPQPRLLSQWVAGFGSFAGTHGFAVNLFVVITLAAVGAALLSGVPRLLRPALAVLAATCLAAWVLVEDLGFFGGSGTDPNSMLPVLLVSVAGYLALVAVPAAAVPAAGEPAPDDGAAAPATPTGSPGAVRRWPTRPDLLRPVAIRRSIRAASLRSTAAAGALAMVAIGAIPVAAATANPNADPIIAQSIAGPDATADFPAPEFHLTDQHGAPVSLASLRGRAVLLTFLDPVCSTDCPLIAQEFRQADQLLGANSRRVELVAVVANPAYYARAFTLAFDRVERLDVLPNWLYLTGTLPQLRQVWRAYGEAVGSSPAGAMALHSDIAFVIDAAGRIRSELNSDPGPGTPSSKSSFAVVLARAAQAVLK
jgi:cytochrome oxidase Cu insertion factor (SCO1/SenC/PrrC family)